MGGGALGRSPVAEGDDIGDDDLCHADDSAAARAGETAEDDELDDRAREAGGEAAAHDLDDADVVDVEVFRVWGHDGEGGLRDEVRQLVLVAVLL